METKCINRNIVECKVNWNRSEPHTSRCINRNIVECKAHKGLPLVPSLRSINRNIVECKELPVNFYAQHRLVLIETLWNVKLI